MFQQPKLIRKILIIFQLLWMEVQYIHSQLIAAGDALRGKPITAGDYYGGNLSRRGIITGKIYCVKGETYHGGRTKHGGNYIQQFVCRISSIIFLSKNSLSWGVCTEGEHPPIRKTQIYT